MEPLDLINLGSSTTNRSLGTTLKDSKKNENFKDNLLRNIHSIKQAETGNKEADKIKDKKLKDLCIQMESLFVSKMLKTMRNTVQKNNFIHGGFAEEVFEDMLYDEYAKTLSERENLGIATMLYDELSGPIR